MDGTEDKTVYERPYFIAALTPLKSFLEKNENIYKNTECTAEVGIYLNRDTHISDTLAFWSSLKGIDQLLLRYKIPFRLVDSDEDNKLKGLKLLIIGNVRLVSDMQFKRFKKFAETDKIIITGESCRFDEYFLLRDRKELDDFLAHKNIIYLKDCPEKINPTDVKYHGTNYNFLPLPAEGDKFIKEVLAVYNPPVKVTASPFVAIDTFKNKNNESFIHILNYDNSNPQDVKIEFSQAIKAKAVSPEVLGIASSEISERKGKTTVLLKGLHTYAVVNVIG